MVFQKLCDEVYGSKNKMASDENNENSTFYPPLEEAFLPSAKNTYTCM